MEQLKEKLKELEGGRILDVATGYGDFIRFLTDSFENYIEAIGVDTAEDRLKEAQERPGNEILYNPMNAEKLAFEDEYFDTVAIHNSIHHLNNIEQVLGEMKRVLKPGGLFIIGEVYQDPMTAEINSHRHWHHWRAAVDRLLGFPHNETLFKQDIIDNIDSLGIKRFDTFEYLSEEQEDDTLKFMQANIADSLEKLREMGGQDSLITRGEKLQGIFRVMSYIPEPTLYILARK